MDSTSVEFERDTLELWNKSKQHFGADSDDKFAKMLLIRIHEKTSFDEVSAMFVENEKINPTDGCRNIIEESEATSSPSIEKSERTSEENQNGNRGDLRASLSAVEMKIVELMRTKRRKRKSNEDEDDDESNANDDDDNEDIARELYECDICGKLVTSAGNLRLHRQTHTDRRQYKCEVCWKSFKRKFHLARHAKMHERNKRLYESETKGNDDDKLEVLVLQARVDDRVDETEKMKSKNDNEDEESILAAAAATSSGANRPYSCLVCDESFFCQSDLSRHQRTRHSGVKPFRCRVCGRAFTRRYHIKRHLVTHGKEVDIARLYAEHDFPDEVVASEYTCEVCGKRYSSQASLHVHRKTIHGQKAAHSCGSCGKSFKSTLSLRKHVKLHVSPGTFLCHHCGKSFFQKGNMVKHIQKLHNRVSADSCNNFDDVGTDAELSDDDAVTSGEVVLQPPFNLQ